MTTINPITEHLYVVRAQIETAGIWSESTISPTKRFDPERPSSGQCAPTSLALLSIMRARFPDKVFRFNAGQLRIDRASGSGAGSHHWLTYHPELAAEPTVLDITPDQFEGIEETVIARPLCELALTGLYYLAYEQHDSPPDPLKEGLPGMSARERADILLTAIEPQTLA